MNLKHVWRAREPVEAACLNVYKNVTSEGLEGRDRFLQELALLTIPAAAIATQIFTQMFTQTPSPSREVLHLPLPGGEVLPREVPRFSSPPSNLFTKVSLTPGHL